MNLKVTVEDVGGSFARFVRTASKVVRAEAYQATAKSRDALADRMRERAAVGPEAPHMRDAIEVRGTLVGIFDPEQAAVALYNEYSPNRQPFMVPSARDEDSSLVNRAKAALRVAEAKLSI
jgi:hypothetical protein